MRILSSATWKIAAQHHESIVKSWTAARLNRRSHGQKHPVEDFLFEYYPISAGKLANWHPGWQYLLEPTADQEEFFDADLYQFAQGIELHSHYLRSRAAEATIDLEFLQSTMNRSARTGCFGLHEWAMVLGEENLRHSQWPLRISQKQIAQTIAEVGLRCTHFDAFRFFSEQARPLNPLQLTRSDQSEVEQPGCLHANMDLYKISMKWVPIVGSLLVRQCFRLAGEIRTLDMRSAPYDLTALGVTPIPIESATGRKEFANFQREFSDRAQILRLKLINKLANFAAAHPEQTKAESSVSLDCKA